MPDPGKRENTGSPFLSPALAPFRTRRFFDNPEQGGAAATLLSVLSASQIDFAGGGQPLRFSPGVALSLRGWNLNLTPVVPANEETLADVTAVYPGQYRRPRVYATIGINNRNLALSTVFSLIPLIFLHIRGLSRVAGLYIHLENVAFL